MARQFSVPGFYRSSLITRVKNARSAADPRKRDLSPSVLDFGPVRYKIARHFGFCYGVENAIEIAYQAISENPDKRIFLLSEMIHNPHVNEDLQARGIRFLRTTLGEQLIPFSELTEDDIAIIPAFGTTLEVESELASIGINTKSYNTTCPFVEKVWKRSEQIGKKNYSIVVHGKRLHEETRATFSHAEKDAPVVVVLDLDEAKELGRVIAGEQDAAFFAERFSGHYSDGFDPEVDLARIGVVNQTTMLATETQAIANYLRDVMSKRFPDDSISDHFADTSDTLCYATNENQNATYALIEDPADLAIVVGGYNSSNTSHLVELCVERMPTYFIKDASALISTNQIQHFDLHTRQETTTTNWLPNKRPVDIVLTAGASCPDALLDQVIERINEWMESVQIDEDVLAHFENLVTADG